MIYFIGDSYAANNLREAARRRGLKMAESIEQADLVFVSQDTPTGADGTRNLEPIRALIDSAKSKAIVITSQVQPGFTRSLKRFDVYHQAETLRAGDGLQRAMYPEMFIVGSGLKSMPIHSDYLAYLAAFDCPVFFMSYEEAEFAKIAINMTLASQVDNTNRLTAAAEKLGCSWQKISQVLRHDSRIGKYSYLTPGDWRKSPHLLRDEVTLKEIEAK